MKVRKKSAFINSEELFYAISIYKLMFYLSGNIYNLRYKNPVR
jgi:hypothetical protein